MTVHREDFLRALEEARTCVTDPRGGIHGPGSMSWRVNREAALFLGGGRAALLQLAHPYVAHAVDQHSQTRTDVHGRFQRTFTNVYAMAFGDLDEAFRSARRVHNIHTRITGEITEDVGAYARGHRYEANDEEALLWVHATLVDSAIQSYELAVRRLADAQKQRYLDESRLFAKLFGIPDRLLWDTWGELQAYLTRMFESDTLTVGEPARTMGQFLLSPPARALRPIARWYTITTAGLLPPRIRAQYGLAFGPRERARFEASLRALRAGYRVLPRRLRFVPAYVEAVRRVTGKGGPDRFGRLLERAATRALGSSFARATEPEARCPVAHGA